MRLALGATELMVTSQFLGEAVFLSLLGGLGGVLASALVANSFGAWVGWPVSVSSRAIAFGLSSSIAVGLCAGLYPAQRAARLDPIAALHHE